MSTTIFITDYDGCLDLLFKDLDKVKHFSRHLALKDKLNTFLNNKAGQADNVEVYIGSMRQSQETDELNNDRNRNGRCFDNLPKLCADRKWLFRPLVLADKRNNKPAGTAFKNKHLTCHSYQKSEILACHLEDITNNHPTDDIVNVYFIDDDCNNKIFPELKQYLEKHKQNLSKNIRVHLIRFQWDRVVAKGLSATTLENYFTHALEEVALIQGQQDEIASMLNSNKFDRYLNIIKMYDRPLHYKLLGAKDILLKDLGNNKEAALIEFRGTCLILLKKKLQQLDNTHGTAYIKTHLLPHIHHKDGKFFIQSDKKMLKNLLRDFEQEIVLKVCPDEIYAKQDCNPAMTIS